jgi:short-subunit dehydrogenase involved in D-alanine esterification of teichoic acids
MAINSIKNNYPELNIILVAKGVDRLSNLGGVLNCISWLYY